MGAFVFCFTHPFCISLIIHSSTGNASCLGDVPVVDRLVELFGTTEHESHGGHLRRARDMEKDEMMECGWLSLELQRSGFATFKCTSFDRFSPHFVVGQGKKQPILV